MYVHLYFWGQFPKNSRLVLSITYYSRGQYLPIIVDSFYLLSDKFAD